MSLPSPLVDRRLAKGLTVVQALMIPVAIVLGYVLAGQIAAKSAGLGASVGWMGSAYFAWQAFRHAGAGASRRILGSFYRGMIGKFIVIVVGFMLVFGTVRPLSAGSVLLGFALVQLMAWIYPIWINHRQITSPKDSA
jgi:ATP synthase protein I